MTCSVCQKAWAPDLYTEPGQTSMCNLCVGLSKKQRRKVRREIARAKTLAALEAKHKQALAHHLTTLTTQALEQATTTAAPVPILASGNAPTKVLIADPSGAVTHQAHPPQATHDMWVGRNKQGELEAIKVVNMTDAHIVRWIQYFRTKIARTRPNVKATDYFALDLIIAQSLVTASAIYGEAAERGLVHPKTRVLVAPPPEGAITKVQPGQAARIAKAVLELERERQAPKIAATVPGQRKVRLED